MNNKKLKLFNLAKKLGVALPDDIEEHIEDININSIKIFDFLPNLVLMIRTVTSKEEIKFNRTAFSALNNGLLFSFHNMHNDGLEDKQSQSFVEEIPHVKIMPLNIYSEVNFPKNSQMKQIVIIVSIEYLKNFFNNNIAEEIFLFKDNNAFYIEEFMSSEIIKIANDISERDSNIPLSDFFLKLKSLELIYLLFCDLIKKKSGERFHSLNPKEVKLIYKARDLLIRQLDAAAPIKELVAITAMNESKLRKLFIQIFGMGIYDYFQHVRMMEAARMLKEDKLSVSDVGYQLGYSNISYFGRVFKKHIGMMPKKYSVHSIGK